MSSSKDTEVIIFFTFKKREFVYFSSIIWFLYVDL